MPILAIVHMHAWAVGHGQRKKADHLYRPSRSRHRLKITKLRFSRAVEDRMMAELSTERYATTMPMLTFLWEPGTTDRRT